MGSRAKYASNKDTIKRVLAEFYRVKLKDGEKIINNSDSTIAKITGVQKSEVQFIISRDLDEHFKRLNKRINSKI